MAAASVSPPFGFAGSSVTRGASGAVLATVTLSVAGAPSPSPSSARTSTLTTCFLCALIAGSVSCVSGCATGAPSTKKR